MLPSDRTIFLVWSGSPPTDHDILLTATTSKKRLDDLQSFYTEPVTIETWTMTDEEYELARSCISQARRRFTWLLGSTWTPK